MQLGAVGVFSGLSRADANTHPGVINVYAGGTRILRVRLVQVDFNFCEPHPVYVQYLPGTGGLVTSAEGVGWGTQQVITGPLIVACFPDQSVEVRFRLGSTTTPLGAHAADGYIEVRVNGDVRLSLTGIALGLDGYDGWDGIGIAPSGLVDQENTNAGMSSLYVNAGDTYGVGASTIIDETYSGLTDAQLWTTLGGPWSRWTSLDIESTTDPVKSGDRVVSNINYMFQSGLESLPQIPGDDSAICPCVPGDTGTVGSGGTPNAGADPWLQPIIGSPVLACVGGGLVPTQADLVHSELWWGL